MWQKEKVNKPAASTSRRKCVDHPHLWLECARRGLTSNPTNETALRCLSIDPFDFECEQFLQNQINSMDVQDILNPDAFRRTNPTGKQTVDGPIRLGVVQGTSAPYGIYSESLRRHMGIFAITGLGKSVTMMEIIRALHRGPDDSSKRPIIILPDRKNEFCQLALDIGLPYFLPEDFPDHLCSPPDKNCEQLWFNLYGEITAAHAGLQFVGQSIITRELTELSATYLGRGRGYPSTRQLATHILRRAEETRGSMRESFTRAGSLLMTLAKYSGYRSVRYPMKSWNTLLQHGWGLSLAGMPTNCQFFDIALTFAKILLQRVTSNRRCDDLEILYAMDECGPIFGASISKKMTLLTDCLMQARAFGFGLLYGSQTTNLAHELFANTGTKLSFQLGHGADYQHLSSAIGLEGDQLRQFKGFSRPGLGVVRDWRYPHPFPVQIIRGGDQ